MTERNDTKVAADRRAIRTGRDTEVTTAEDTGVVDWEDFMRGSAPRWLKLHVAAQLKTALAELQKTEYLDPRSLAQDNSLVTLMGGTLSALGSTPTPASLGGGTSDQNIATRLRALAVELGFDSVDTLLERFEQSYGAATEVGRTNPAQMASRLTVSLNVLLGTEPVDDENHTVWQGRFDAQQAEAATLRDARNAAQAETTRLTRDLEALTRKTQKLPNGWDRANTEQLRLIGLVLQNKLNDAPRDESEELKRLRSKLETANEQNGRLTTANQNAADLLTEANQKIDGLQKQLDEHVCPNPGSDNTDLQKQYADAIETARQADSRAHVAQQTLDRIQADYRFMSELLEEVKLRLRSKLPDEKLQDKHLLVFSPFWRIKEHKNGDPDVQLDDQKLVALGVMNPS